MDRLLTLIDKAQEVCGGQKGLAERLEISTEYLRLMRKKERPIPLEIAGQLAMITGSNVESAVLLATTAQLSRTSNGRTVLNAMERGFLALVAVIFCTFATESAAHGNQTYSEPNNISLNNSHIVSRRLAFRARQLWQFAREAAATVFRTLSEALPRQRQHQPDLA